MLKIDAGNVFDIFNNEHNLLPPVFILKDKNY